MKENLSGITGPGYGGLVTHPVGWLEFNGAFNTIVSPTQTVTNQ